MEVKDSEAQGRHREVGSEGSVEQRDEQEPHERLTASSESAHDAIEPGKANGSPRFEKREGTCHTPSR